MSERIITLFGEEIVPEQLKAVGRSRAKKKNEDKEDALTDEPIAEAEESAIVNENATQAVVATEAEVNTPTSVQGEVPTDENKLAATPVEVVENTYANPVQDAAGEEISAAVDEQSDTQVPPKKERAVLANLPDDWHGEKKYYSIGEVAEIFKVKTSHIRFWTNEFKLKVRTTRKGDRLYTPEQIKEIRTINNLVKERGFTIKGAKTRLKAPEKMEVETVDLKQSLLQLRNKLVAIKNQLK